MKDLANIPTQTTEGDALRQLVGKAEKARNVTLIYVPMYFGGCHKGACMGPAAMQVAHLSESLQSIGVKVQKEIEVSVPRGVTWSSKSKNSGRDPKCLVEVLKVSEHVAELVEQALEDGSVPITIGGDHSLAIGSVAGASSYYRKRNENFGLLWFDAHGDINTPETSPSGNLHGMPVAIGLGKGDPRLTNLHGFAPKLDPKRVTLLGTRDLDNGERLHIQETGVTPFTMREIDKLGFGRVIELALNSIGTDVSGYHVSFDLDVMDPDVAPGVCLPARGGLNYREAALALTLLAETEMVRSIDMVELNPAGDIRNKSAELAVELLKTALGERIL